MRRNLRLALKPHRRASHRHRRLLRAREAARAPRRRDPKRPRRNGDRGRNSGACRPLRGRAERSAHSFHQRAAALQRRDGGPYSGGARSRRLRRHLRRRGARSVSGERSAVPPRRAGAARGPARRPLRASADPRRTKPAGFRRAARLSRILAPPQAGCDRRDRGGRRARHLQVLHDTFHHAISGEESFFADETGLVHVSGEEEERLPVSSMRDAHRVLVGPRDRLDNIGQIEALLGAGYRGFFSFEPFAESVHDLSDTASALKESVAWLSGDNASEAA